MVPLVFANALGYLLILSQLAYTRNAGNWVDRSIEILRPRVDALTHLELRAQLRSVETARQFYMLEARLHKLANSTDSVLPKFNVVRTLHDD